MFTPPPSSPPAMSVLPPTRPSPRRSPPARLHLPKSNTPHQSRSPNQYPTSVLHRRGSSDPSAPDHGWSTSSIPIMLDGGDEDPKGSSESVPQITGIGTTATTRNPPIAASSSTNTGERGQLKVDVKPGSSRRRPSHGISPIEFSWDAGSEPGLEVNLARVDTESAHQLKKRAFLAGGAGGSKARPRVLDDEMNDKSEQMEDKGIQHQVVLGPEISLSSTPQNRRSSSSSQHQQLSPKTPLPPITPITPLADPHVTPRKGSHDHSGLHQITHTDGATSAAHKPIRRPSLITTSISYISSMRNLRVSPHGLHRRKSQADTTDTGEIKGRSDVAHSSYTGSFQQRRNSSIIVEPEPTSMEHTESDVDPSPLMEGSGWKLHDFHTYGDQSSIRRTRQNTRETTRTARSFATGSSLFDMGAYVRSDSQAGVTEESLMIAASDKVAQEQTLEHGEESLVGLGMQIADVSRERLKDDRASTEALGGDPNLIETLAEEVDPTAPASHLRVQSENHNQAPLTSGTTSEAFEYDSPDYFSVKPNRHKHDQHAQKGQILLADPPQMNLKLQTRNIQPTHTIPEPDMYGPTSSTIAEPGVFASEMEKYMDMQNRSGNHLSPLEEQLASFKGPIESSVTISSAGLAASTSDSQPGGDDLDDPTSTFPGQAGYDIARYAEMVPSTTFPSTLKTPDKEIMVPFARKRGLTQGTINEGTGQLRSPLPGWNTMTPGSVHTMAQSPSWFDSPDVGVGSGRAGNGEAGDTGRFRTETNESHASTRSLMKAFDKESTIQLWIDQEGYRAVRASFRYIKSIPAEHFRSLTSTEEDQSTTSSGGRASSTARKNSADYTETFGVTGCLEFRMEQMEVWPFHSGSLERLPTLRRLTVDLQTEWDYLTRQALLNLRKNGVYRVSGTEGKGKLAWTFEYMVDDRRSAATGKLLPGEKIVLPLSFCCSPSLLSSSRARKTHLFNILRKTVTPRIASSKLAPPRLKPRTPDPLAGPTSGSLSVASSPKPSVRSFKDPFGFKRSTKATVSPGSGTASTSNPLSPSRISEYSQSPFDAQFAQALTVADDEMLEDLLMTPILVSAQSPFMQTPSTTGFPTTPNTISPGSSSSATPRRRPLTPHATSPHSAVRPPSIPPFPSYLAKEIAGHVAGHTFIEGDPRKADG